MHLTPALQFVTLCGVMKRTFLYLTLLTGIFAGVLAPAAFADEDAAPKTEKTSKKGKKAKGDAGASSLSPVAEALSNIELMGGKPLKGAKYYVYLHSASWCGPCKALMPQIVKEYKKMQKKKIEVILIGHDKTPEAAKAYLEHYKADFPCILYTDPAVNSLPGYTANFAGIPHATIVDAEGNQLMDGHGKITLEWKTVCKPAKKKKK